MRSSSSRRIDNRSQQEKRWMCCDSATSSARPGVVHVIGASDSGKTTLIERLIPRLRANGIRIGTVKHTHHGFEMDRPGKDSWRHVQAGADAIAVISPERAAWIMRTPDEHSIHEATSPMEIGRAHVSTPVTVQ